LLSLLSAIARVEAQGPVPTPAPAGSSAPAASASAPPASAPAATLPRLTLVDAVRSTLRHHPAIAQARASFAARSAERLAAGAPFDPVLSATLAHDHDQLHLLPGERFDPAERALVTDTTGLTVGASAGFQWGMTVLPSVSLERLKQRRDPNPLGAPSDPAQRARADLTVLQHLLRGRGTAGSAYPLRSAERSLRAAEHAIAHAAQAQVFGTLVAYYRLVAARSDLTRLRASLARSQQLLEETRLLVQAEQRTRADLRQIEASLANQNRGLLDAESNATAARYELGLAIGLDGRALADWDAADGFPPAQPVALAPAAAQARALAARRDLAAANELVAAAAELVTGAERNSLPALDLALSVGYAGALGDDGVGPFFAAAARNVPGVNAGASLTLELPVANDAARAERDLRSAEQRSAEIARDDLARQVRTNAASALAEVELAAAALAAAEQAVALLGQAVTDERDKLREGLSTVIDVVLTEERLTQAELTATSHALRHAIARARLQLELGALPGGEGALGADANASTLLAQGVANAGR
jgi:outer membrane protein TolC